MALNGVTVVNGCKIPPLVWIKIHQMVSSILCVWYQILGTIFCVWYSMSGTVLFVWYNILDT